MELKTDPLFQTPKKIRCDKCKVERNINIAPTCPVCVRTKVIASARRYTRNLDKGQ